MGEAPTRLLPDSVGMSGELGGCPIEDGTSSSDWGEPGGEWGEGNDASLLRSGRMTKVGSGFHPMLFRLLGRREERDSLGGRTGNESGTKVGQ